VVTDGESKLNIIWFNQSYLAKAIQIGETYLFDGKMSTKNNDFSSPSYEKFSGSLSSQTHIGKITPFYPETAGISSKC
jgi:ATP-dependent DNA helicase RecG